MFVCFFVCQGLVRFQPELSASNLRFDWLKKTPSFPEAGLKSGENSPVDKMVVEIP